MQSKARGSIIPQETYQSLKLRIKDVFRMYDTSGDGELDTEELHRAFRVLSPSFTDEEIDTFAKEVDQNGGGTISYSEFFRWIKQGSSSAKNVAKSIVASGDARATKIRETFERYDTSGDGSLNIAEMGKMLKTLGPFSGLEVKCICDDLDKSKDGEISYEEFVTWMRSHGGGREIAKAKAILAPTDEDGLEGIFYNFCGAGQVDMDNQRFFRMCLDSGLTNDGFNKAEVDRIWRHSKVMPKNLRRRIGFQQFEIALELLADKKGVPLEQVRAAVLKAERPARRNLEVTDDEVLRLCRLPAKPAFRKMAEISMKQRSLLAVPVDISQAPPDNTDLWKVFGGATPAGKALKHIYSPRDTYTPRRLPPLADSARVNDSTFVTGNLLA
mmetsp:Transcript_86044/g.151970  ORF Transcript_86044/g.151970 Transcript_86044/m.151970 type:complete len:385 (+) Transcript_86044:48-1202(+)